MSFLPELDKRQPAEMSIVHHLEELRRRLIIATMALIVASIGSFAFVDDLVKWLTGPAGKLYYLNPSEAFFAYMKVTVFSGFLIALPIILYQAWAFVVPAMTTSEKRLALILVPSSVALFFTGIAFSYFLVLPIAVTFFMGFASESLQPLFSLGQYLSFVLAMLLPFGFVFELPLVLFVLAKFGLITSAFLASKRKIALLSAFIIGGVVSPTPDIFGQVMIAVPLLLLYEGSVWMVRAVLHK